MDRQRIVDTALNGYGVIGETIVPATTGKWHDSSQKPLPFSISKANQILDKLGYKKGSNGIRVANGQPMSYEVIVPNSRADVLTPTFRVIQGDFKKIGVELKEKVLDPNGAFAAITAPNNKYTNFDLAMWDWIPSVDPDSILSVLLCNQYGSNSDTGYCNKKYDSLYQKQAQELNVKKRVQLVHQAQDMIATDRPYIILNYPDVIEAWSKSWTGFYPLPGVGIFDLYQSMLQVHPTSG
jgi:peptide/nickel transport system substrate-binding protein